MRLSSVVLLLGARFIVQVGLVSATAAAAADSGLYRASVLDDDDDVSGE